jgi:transposase
LELSGETVPRPVLRRADGWWDVVPVSTAIRAPQVLLRLTDNMSEQRRTGMLFLGIDWGERHHDLCLLDQDGNVLATRRITDGLAGVGALHALVAAHAQDPAQVVVGIETDRGLLVGVLLAAGYQVYAVNPQVVSRYRGRHGSSRAKSDRGDAKVLADMVRTDRHNHRQVAGDSSLVEAVKVLARAHQSLIWARQRHVNALRSALRDFYPGALAALGTHLADPEALAVLELAPAPEQGRRLTRAAVRQALIQAGRRRNLPGRVVAVHDALAAPQLAAPEQLEAAYREVVGALVTVLGCLNVQVAALEEQLTLRFAVHRDAGIVQSLPGLGVVLGGVCWLSSATTHTATPPLRAARRLPAPRRSPAPRGFALRWLRGRRAISGWWMPAIYGPSQP